MTERKIVPVDQLKEYLSPLLATFFKVLPVLGLASCGFGSDPSPDHVTCYPVLRLGEEDQCIVLEPRLLEELRSGYTFSGEEEPDFSRDPNTDTFFRIGVNTDLDPVACFPVREAEAERKLPSLFRTCSTNSEDGK